MADRTAIPVTDVPSSAAYDPASFDWTDADATNKNRFRYTGREVLLIRNAGSAQSVTIVSADDPYSRTEDITESVASGGTVAAPFMDRAGWVQTDGYVHVNAGSSAIKLAVLRVPARR